MNEFDAWMVINGERLRDGKTAVADLLPYLNSTVDADLVVPTLLRLEAAVSEMTYSDFDAGKLSAAYAQTGSTLRAGLNAIDTGDGPMASQAFNRALEQYNDALTQTMRLVQGPDPPRPRRRWWPWLLALAVLIVLL